MKRFLGACCCFVAAGHSISASAQDRSYIVPADPMYEEAKSHFIEITNAGLKDAESARIGSVIVCGWLPDAKLALIQVNAKNSYGAYTGFKLGGVVDADGVQRVIFVNPNPSNPTEYSDQRALLKILESCEPAIAAYEAGGFEQ